MPKAAVHITFLFFLLTALTGFFMRYLILSPDNQIIPFDFILHGHSHGALLGWTFLGVFIIFLKLIWHELETKKQAIGIIVTTLIVTVCMFVAFLYQGYATYSIIFSTLHIGVEYWMVVFIFQTMKTTTAIPLYSKRFIKGALVSLMISTFGPFALGGLGMAGMKASPFFDMAIYFFLHFQYNGWLYLMLVGTFLIILHQKNITMSNRLLRLSFWLYIVSLLPAYLSSILWYGLGTIGTTLSIFGNIGQFAGILLLGIAMLQKNTCIRQSFSTHIQLSLLFVFMLLFAKTLMEFGLWSKPFAAMIFETRSVVVGYLHLMLLGFISIFILTQYQMTELLDEQKNTVLYGLALFVFAFLINEVVLFSIGLGHWVGFVVPFGNEVLLLASALLFAGIFMVWVSVFQRESIYYESDIPTFLSYNKHNK